MYTSPHSRRPCLPRVRSRLPHHVLSSYPLSACLLLISSLPVPRSFTPSDYFTVSVSVFILVPVRFPHPTPPACIDMASGCPLIPHLVVALHIVGQSPFEGERDERGRRVWLGPSKSLELEGRSVSRSTRKPRTRHLPRHHPASMGFRSRVLLGLCLIHMTTSRFYLSPSPFHHHCMGPLLVSAR